jgi:acetyl-CoA carboxylase biotin carboxyl carrier protein
VSLTAKDVAEIVRILEDSTFDELDLEIDGMRLTLRRGAGGAVEEAGEPAPRASRPARSEAHAPAVKSAPSAPADPSLAEVHAPLLGVFYRAPKPGEAPFVEVGAPVEEDTVIAIIEVMKLMNSVRAGVSGVVEDILVENGALVEYGQTLMRVRRAE